MRVARAAALGLLHGPLELLPVSSSAHVALLTGDEPSKDLEVALHAGTLAALGLPRPAAWLAVATAPAALGGALLAGPIEERLGRGGALAGGLVAGAAALAAADRAPARRRGRPTLTDAAWLGLAQAAALVPGVSRHGAVLAAARARGFDRPAAHALSRAAGRPVLAGATALKAARLAARRPPRGELAPLAAGALASAVSTRVALRLLPAATRAPLWPYAAYRVALAAAMVRAVPAPVPLPGRTVAITGGARGIGRATAAELHRRGARVVVGDLDPEVTGLDGVTALPLDVTDEGSFAAFLDAAAPDVLVNNAGIGAVAPFVEETAAQQARVLAVNVGGVATGTRLAVRRGVGHVVNVASAAARFATPGIATYTATKHAVLGLTDALRAEAPGTAFTAVLPGPVETEMIAGTSRSPLVRVVEPAQVARAIADAIERPRAEVWVPRDLGVLWRVLAPASARVRLRAANLLRADRMYTEVDHARRAGYEARTWRR